VRPLKRGRRARSHSSGYSISSNEDLPKPGRRTSRPLGEIGHADKVNDKGSVSFGGSDHSPDKNSDDDLNIKDKNLDNMLLGQNHEKKKKDANRGADKTLNSRRNLKQ
jgi:hypothetical protein